MINPYTKMLISHETIDLIQKSITKCHKCSCQIEYCIVGDSIGRTLVGICKNNRCINHRPKENQFIGTFNKVNLATVFHTLTQDTGYVGYQQMCNSIQSKPLCKSTYYKHCDFLYSIVESFYNINLPLIHKDVKTFYLNNDLGTIDENGILDIAVAVDGSYSHIGFSSSGGVSFITELWTGRPIDVNYISKCFKCKDCNKNTAYANLCPDQLYHGTSSSMEMYNAITLFKRSLQYGFRYSTYVSDGDSKVFPALSELGIYNINKIECSNHLAKRCQTALIKLANSYTDVKVQTDDSSIPTNPKITDFFKPNGVYKGPAITNNNTVSEEQNPNDTTVSSIIDAHCPDDTDVSSKSNVSASGANTSDNTKGITDHCTSNDTSASIISTSGANTSDNTKGITEHCTSNGTSASIISSTPVRTLRSKSSQVITQPHSSDSIVQLDGPNDPHYNKKDSKLSKQQNKASKSSNSNKYQFNF